MPFLQRRVRRAEPRRTPTNPERCSRNEWGAQPPQLHWGERTQQTVNRLARGEWTARARATAPEAGALPRTIASFPLREKGLLRFRQVVSRDFELVPVGVGKVNRVCDPVILKLE